MNLEWRRRPLFFAALILSAGIFLCTEAGWPPEDLSPHSLEVSDAARALTAGGRIVSEVERRRDDYGGRAAVFILQAERVWETADNQARPVRSRLRVLWREAPADLRYGDLLVLQGKLSAFQTKRNLGGFDSRAYWKRRGVQAYFQANRRSEYKILGHGRGNFLKAGMIQLKQALSRRLSRDFEARDAGFLKSLFLGERRDLEEDIKELFFKTGTIHILAVSGFNIGFLSAVFWFLMKPLPLPRDWKLSLILFVIWFYAALVGWQAPVMRAAVMATAWLCAQLLGRRADALNFLGLAALILLIKNPSDLYDIGFQLSFLAVFGIIMLAPAYAARPAVLPNEKRTWRENAWQGFRELFWISFLCAFLTLPVTVQNFFIVSPVSLLANLIVVPLAFLIFFAGFLYFAAGWAKAGWLLKEAAALLMSLMVKALEFLESIPGSAVVVGRLPAALWAVLAIGIVYFLYTPRLRHPARVPVLFLFCLNIFLIQDVVRRLDRHFEMTMLDVGQGDAVYFEFPEGGNLLVDAGPGLGSDQGRFAVTPFLRLKGIRRLDAVLISHPHEDHIGGLPSVLEAFEVKSVVVSGFPYPSKLWKQVQDSIARENSKVWTAKRGNALSGFHGVSMDVLHPPEGTPSENINNDSLVVRVRHTGGRILLAGDVQEEAMADLLSSGQPLGAEVLKVPHHGGKLKTSGKAFVRAVAPRISLISLGKNNRYGHPSPETLRTLEKLPGNRVLRTDKEGALRLDSSLGLAYDATHAK